MRSRNRLRWLLAASAACLLAACTPTAPERNGQPQAVSAQDSSTASAPAVLAENERQQRVLAFLHHRYGASASTGAAWRDSWDDRAQRRARRVHRQLCSNQPAMIAGVQHSLVAVCTRLDDVVDPTTPGLIDFIVLRAASDDGLEVAMQRLDDPHGSHGVPGEVSVLQLGADLHAYRIENGWSGQGYALSSQRLLLVGNDGLTDAGSLRSHIDNTGAFDCDVDDCDGKRFSIDFVLAPDDSQRTLAVWPLQVHESGFDCQGPVAREHLLEFDTTRGRYPVPHALQREGC